MDLPAATLDLLYHFCRLQLPHVGMATDAFTRHLQRTYDLFQGKAEQPVGWDQYLENLYPLDWYLASACLDNNPAAWEQLFAARGRDYARPDGRTPRLDHGQVPARCRIRGAP